MQLIINANGTTSISDNEKKEDKEPFLGAIFVMRSNFDRFNNLTKDLLREDIQGTDKYPTTVSKAYELLQEYEISCLMRTQNYHNNHN